MDNRYEIAEQNGMSREFADWFFDNKKAGCGNVWFMMMAAMWEGWQGRAAMLQGADGTLTNEGTIPANTPCKEAPEHIWLQTAGVWPENGEFSELTWCSDSQHQDDTLYVRADVVTGNSPVIPDGWALVPVEPTAEMISSGIAAHYERSQIQIHDRPAPGPMECAYVAMLAAAPQQEVK